MIFVFVKEIVELHSYLITANFKVRRLDNIIPLTNYFPQPFRAWCPKKGHTYLNKSATLTCESVLSIRDILMNTRYLRSKWKIFKDTK